MTPRSYFIAISLIVCVTSGHAQAPQTSSTTASNTETPPLAGANSFTQSQAQDRIQKAGFTNVSQLTKDASGIWRAKAQKDGKAIDVALDYRGNIVAR